MYVGLSLSFCVKDICEGRIPLSEVAFICPGFSLDEPDAVWRAYESYKDIYWVKYPTIAAHVLEQLQGDKIRQHPTPVNIAAGHWLRLEDYSPELDLQGNDALKIYNIANREVTA